MSLLAWPLMSNETCKVPIKRNSSHCECLIEEVGSVALVFVLVLALTLATGFPFTAALLCLGTPCGLPLDCIMLPLSILVNLFPVTSTGTCHAQ